MATSSADWIKWILFFAGSAGLLAVSRASLLRPRSHGFSRWLAWEAILALILLNLDRWLTDPFSPRQLVSWLLLILSLVLVVAGLAQLRAMGQPDPRREGEALLGLERTTHLVTAGIYRWIRHPMYASLLFLAWGAFLKWLTWPGLALVVVVTMFLFLTARIEESEDRAFFGPAYLDYMKHSWMFVPFLI